MNERTALQEKVENLEKNVGEIKADIKRLDAKLDTDVKRLDAKIDSVNAALTEHRVETQKSFGEVHKAIGELRVEMIERLEKFSLSRAALLLTIISTLITAVGATAAVVRYLPAR